MESEQPRIGQRIQVHVPGIGDDGQFGTIVRLRRGKCYVHLDWDPNPQRLVMFYPSDLEHLPQLDKQG